MGKYKQLSLKISFCKKEFQVHRHSRTGRAYLYIQINIKNIAQSHNRSTENAHSLHGCTCAERNQFRTFHPQPPVLRVTNHTKFWYSYEISMQKYFRFRIVKLKCNLFVCTVEKDIRSFWR